MADQRRRVTLPKGVHAGDVFNLEEKPDGKLVLTKLASSGKSRVKLIRDKGLVLLSSPDVITWEETRKAMDEFP